MAVAVWWQVAFLMVAVAEDLEPSNSHDKRTRIRRILVFLFALKEESSLKSAYFRYNRTDREIEEKSDVEMNL